MKFSFFTPKKVTLYIILHGHVFIMFRVIVETIMHGRVELCITTEIVVIFQSIALAAILTLSDIRY